MATFDYHSRVKFRVILNFVDDLLWPNFSSGIFTLLCLPNSSELVPTLSKGHFCELVFAPVVMNGCFAMITPRPEELALLYLLRLLCVALADGDRMRPFNVTQFFVTKAQIWLYVKWIFAGVWE